MTMKTFRSETLRQRLEHLGIALSRGIHDRSTSWILEKEDPVLRRSWQLWASNLNDVEELVQKLERHVP